MSHTWISKVESLLDKATAQWAEVELLLGELFRNTPETLEPLTEQHKQPQAQIPVIVAEEKDFRFL